MYRQRQALLGNWLNEACPSKYRDLDLLMRRRKPQELGLPRQLLRNLIAARTVHGNFAAHHRRFNNPGALIDCTCGEATTPIDFIHCRINANTTRRIRGALSHSALLQKLVGPKFLKNFKPFAQKTNCSWPSPVCLFSSLNSDRT